MQGKLELLAERVEKVLGLLDRVKHENLSLKQENERFKAELVGLRKECRELKLENADRSQAVKSKLMSVLDRLEELESFSR